MIIVKFLQIIKYVPNVLIFTITDISCCGNKKTINLVRYVLSRFLDMAEKKQFEKQPKFKINVTKPQDRNRNFMHWGNYNASDNKIMHKLFLDSFASDTHVIFLQKSRTLFRTPSDDFLTFLSNQFRKPIIGKSTSIFFGFNNDRDTLKSNDNNMSRFDRGEDKKSILFDLRLKICRSMINYQCLIADDNEISITNNVGDLGNGIERDECEYELERCGENLV